MRAALFALITPNFKPIASASFVAQLRASEATLTGSPQSEIKRCSILCTNAAISFVPETSMSLLETLERRDIGPLSP
jgi:hypothetical protein